MTRHEKPSRKTQGHDCGTDSATHSQGHAGGHATHTHSPSDSHSHSHVGGHHHAPSHFDRAFAIGISLNIVFVVAEVIFGMRAQSLALTADAGHNLSDVLALVLAWIGSILARRAPSLDRTYGMRRFSILAALANAILLLGAVAVIIYEALGRLNNPAPVNSSLVMIVATIGIIINLGTALGFRRGRESDLNVRGAFLHMVGDAAVSAGVVIAGLAIRFTGWMWLDPAVSIALALIIAVSSWGLLRDSVNLALDAVPRGINIVAVRDYLASLPGVTDVHDLHVWAMSTTHVALTAHLVVPNLPIAQTQPEPQALSSDALLAHVCRELRERFNIEHSTLQIEQGLDAHPCGLAPAHVV